MTKNDRPQTPAPWLANLTETFGLSRGAAIAAIVFVSGVVVASVAWFIYSSPPRTLTITAGRPGSTFDRNAEAYREILARDGVTLNILRSGGSVQNLERLANSAYRVDLGFIQARETDGSKGAKLRSLGSVAYQPLLVFHQSAAPKKLLSDLAGDTLAIGPVGSGTRSLALALLATNGIAPGGSTTLLSSESEDAAAAFLEGQIDVLFLMGDSAAEQTMRTLMHSPGVQLFDFVQADAYTRRFGYLNKLVLPRGSLDFGKDFPPHDVNLVGPTVELVARASLHPALSDLVLAAAREVHGSATLMQRRGEFPAPLEHEFKISEDAARFYKSGKSFFYRSLPFWLASLLNRVLVAFVPMLLVLIPGLRLIPTIYRWQIQLRIYRWYRSLLKLERELFAGNTSQPREQLQERLNQIEQSVNQMKVPASFAGQFYGLRQHIDFVRARLGAGAVTEK